MKSGRLLSIFDEAGGNRKTKVLKDVIQSTLNHRAPIKTKLEVVPTQSL